MAIYGSVEAEDIPVLSGRLVLNISFYQFEVFPNKSENYQPWFIVKQTRVFFTFI